MSSKIIQAEWFNSSYKYTLRDLRDHIIATKIAPEPNRIKVFTFEASAGKTQTVCESLKELYKIDPSVKTLIATKLTDVQDEMQKSLGDIAFVVNSKKEESIKEQEKKENFDQYPVLIITHKLYTQLAKNEQRRQLYVRGRDLLIIDEQLDILDILEYSASKAEKITTVLKSAILYKKDVDLCKLWGEIVAPLNDAVKENYQKSNQLVYIKDERIQAKINYLIKLIEQSKFPANAVMEKSEIIPQIQKISQFFNNNNVIASGGMLYTYNADVDYFLLNNNIMLDASGTFLHLYEISDKFDLYYVDREILHTNTTLTFIEENSTTTAINKDEEKYYNAIMDYIQKHITKDDKVLIIGRNSDEEYISPLLSENVEFVNFDSMRGKNNWANFNKCFVIHLPNDQFYKYALQYAFYTKRDLQQKDLEINKKGNNQGFVNNDDLEELHITDVVSSLYQGLKRVNRINPSENECELYVVTNNKRIQELLKEQFKGLKQVKYDKLFQRPTLTEERALKLKNLLETLEPGKDIKKADIRELLGISTRHEYNKVLKLLGGKEYLQKIGIVEQGHKYYKTYAG